MAILVDAGSRVLVLGTDAPEGIFHPQRMLAAGTCVVGGVAPGGDGQRVCGVPVFHTVTVAVTETGADVAVLFVPVRFARTAALDVAAAGLRLIVLVTEGVPIRDVIEIRAELDRLGTAHVVSSGSSERPPRSRPSRPGIALLGPGCFGVISPGQSSAGTMNAALFTPGRIGIVSRSAGLACEIVHGLSAIGLGQSSCVGIGADPVHGIGFAECLRLFEADEQTDAVVLIGEIGGDEEELAAEYAAAHMSKPVVGYVAGFTAPPGRRMGHAGAMVRQGAGDAAAKTAALEAAGIPVARRPDAVPALVAGMMKRRR